MRRLPPELRYSGVYATSAELGLSEARTEDDIAEMLGGLSAYDCMGMIGRLSASLHTRAQSQSPSVQLSLVRWLAGWSSDWMQRLTGALNQGALVLFPQQLAHLARLVARYADPRPPEEFTDQAAQLDFLACLFGVADLFYDADVDLRDPNDRLGWALRHSAIGHRQERLTLWSTYFEVFCRIWPTLAGDGVPDADAAFRRFTGMSIQTFMAAGMAFTFAFAAQGEGGAPGRGHVVVDEYFRQTQLGPTDIRAYLDVSATSLDDLRASLAGEEKEFGATTFRALAYERTPLLLGPGDRVYLISHESLERRVTEGILHVLAEGAVEEGEDRERYTGPFGNAFQQWVAKSFERVNDGFENPPKLFVDKKYGPKRQRKDTPDVVLRYPRTIVAAEIVSGPLQARTLTHGDLAAFERDLQKLIDKKADQLTKRISEIEAGEAAEIGLDTANVGLIWPVIVTATAFPQRPEIGPVIRQRLKAKGLLQGRRIRPLSVVTAEEIAAAEGAMEEGTPFVELLREWKADRNHRDHSFKNFLIFREEKQRGPPAEYHRAMYAQATRALVGEILGEAGLSALEDSDDGGS